MNQSGAMDSVAFLPTPLCPSLDQFSEAAIPRSSILVTTPPDDIWVESPTPKRRRLNSNDTRYESSYATEPLNESVRDNQDLEDFGIINGSPSLKDHADDFSLLQNDWHSSSEAEYRYFGGGDNQVFLEQIWGDRPVEINYEIEDEPEENPDETVCFGMLDDLPITIGDGRTSGMRDGVIAAKIRYDRVLLESDSKEVGSVKPAIAKAIRVLSEGPDITLQLRCTTKTELRTPRRRKTLKTNSVIRAYLSVIIYGSLRNFDSVGDYVEKCDLYLQDPEGCDRNVAYRNPHRLSDTSKNPPMTMEIDVEYANNQKEALGVAGNFLETLECQQELREAVTPVQVTTPLKPHQRQALTFMSMREKGWDLHGTRPDVWKNAGRGCYLNTISSEMQVGAPPSFQGGILADYMGLGKSLTIISLIASDSSPDWGCTSTPCATPREKSSNHLRCTLIIVPPNLLHIWSTQLRRHLASDSIRYRMHHGKDRVRHRNDLVDLDVLITTYQTIATEFQKRHTSSSILFTVNWHRIVLDEAHYIRDRATVTAKAVCALEGRRRWAVTGTPLQNGVADLSSLFQFVRAYPYSDPRLFDQDILRKIGTENQNEGVQRLKKLFSCVAIRRSNTTIDLPPRTDIVHPVSFSSQEKKLYERVRAQAEHVLKKAKNADDTSHQTYRNVLRYITALRMICNLGTAATLPSKSDIQGNKPPETNVWSTIAATEVYEDLLAAGQACCQHCKVPIDSIETSESANIPSLPLVAQCLRILCGECSRNVKISPQVKPWCGHRSHCAFVAVDPNLRLKSISESQFMPLNAGTEVSSKISSLVKALQSTEFEKSIVFSTWTSTLDAIEKVLRAACIRFVRYDGAVSPTHRVAVLDAFRNDPSVSVMLITTACGAVGLDLTAASRAYLMEPHWNPTVEEQALARIHRMGQTKAVTTVRFVIANSYEQHVINVKRDKTRMAERLFPDNRAGATPDLIQDLKTVIEADGGVAEDV